MTRPRKNRAKLPIQTERGGYYVNPTSRHGWVIHEWADTIPRTRQPACGLRMGTVVYTGEPVNCPRCKEVISERERGAAELSA